MLSGIILILTGLVLGVIVGYITGWYRGWADYDAECKK